MRIGINILRPRGWYGGSRYRHEGPRRCISFHFPGPKGRANGCKGVYIKQIMRINALLGRVCYLILDFPDISMGLLAFYNNKGVKCMVSRIIPLNEDIRTP